MNGSPSVSSSSSLSSSLLVTEDDQTIARILAQDENRELGHRLGKRVSHLDFIPFRALADQLYPNSEYHKYVRKAIIKQLKHYNHFYKSYVPEKYRRYLRRMKKLGEWGDHLTLQAAADRFDAKICLITSFQENRYVEIIPRDRRPTREVWISFWSEVHYFFCAPIDVPGKAPKKNHWRLWGLPLSSSLI